MLTKPKQGSLHGQVASPCLAPQWLPPSRQSTPELPPFPLFNTPMLSLPSPFLPLLPTPLSCPQPFNLVSQSRRKRERSASARARTWPPDLVLKLPCVRAPVCVCYAGVGALSAAFGQRTEGFRHHEDGPVPVRCGRRLGSAGAAAGTAPRSVGRAVSEGENTLPRVAERKEGS